MYVLYSVPHCTAHEVSFSGFDVVADSQLSGIDPQADPYIIFFFALYP